MSDPQAELHEYLKANNLNATFVSIVEAILVEKPENPIGFMTKYLLDKFPNETKEYQLPAVAKPPDVVLAKDDGNGDELSDTESDQSSVDTDATVSPSRDEEQPRRKKRRESIFAEKIDDEAEVELKVIEKQQHESERILHIMKSNLFFRHLAQDQMNHVVSAMFLVEKQEGDIIINQGDDGDNFYIIDSGTVEVFIKTIGSDEEAKMVKTCEAGDSFGELALMYNAPRAATCIAKGDVQLWALDRVAFKFILMKTTAAQRDAYRGFLSSAKVFSELKEYEILTIADALVEETYEDNVAICKQNEIGDKFYIVMDGTAVCTQTGADGESRTVLELSSGSYFGEIALLTTKTRQATVTSRGQLKCLSMDRKTFNRVIQTSHGLADQMLIHIAEYETFSGSHI